MRAMQSMQASLRPSLAGARARTSRRASKRRCGGTSIMTGGGGPCASVTRASASASSSLPGLNAMRMLVTGREGQLVRALCERAPAAGFEIIALGRPELDLAGLCDTLVEA